MQTYFAQARRKDDYFVYFAHFLQEVVNTGTLDHIDIVPVVLDLDRHNIVGLGYRLCKAVNRCETKNIGRLSP